MSKSDYKIISNSDDIIIKKKEDKYKLEFVSDIKNIDSFIKIISTHKFFELMYLLNKDLIDNFKFDAINSTDSELLYTLSIMDDDEYDEFDKYFIKTNNQMEIRENNSNNFICKIKSKSDSDFKYKDYKKIYLEDMVISVDINKKKSKCELSLSFKFKEKQIIHIENVLSMLFKKVLYRLKKYINE